MLIFVKNDAQSCLREPSMCRYDVPIIILKSTNFTHISLMKFEEIGFQR